MTATKDRLRGGSALQGNESHSLQDSDIVTTSRFGRRSFLRATGAVVAGSVATVAGLRPAATSDNDPGDPAGNGEAHSGYSDKDPGDPYRLTGVSDKDPSDPGGNGRGSGHSDADPEDAVGFGRGCGYSDNDRGSVMDPFEWSGSSNCNVSGATDNDPGDPFGSGRRSRPGG